MILSDIFFHNFIKHAGGPGSGVTGKNTKPIGLPTSEYVSVGTRKALLDNMPFDVKEIPLDHIKKVGQENYVPKKLKKFIRNPALCDLPFDVLGVSDKEYHVIDGHHRFLACRHLGRKTVKVKVYRRRKDAD